VHSGDKPSSWKRAELDIGPAFATLVDRGTGALVVGPHILFERNAITIVELAARHKIPTIYSGRWFAALTSSTSNTLSSQ
jgi:hypothetical protein